MSSVIYKYKQIGALYNNELIGDKQEFSKAVNWAILEAELCCDFTEFVWKAMVECTKWMILYLTKLGIGGTLS